MAKASDNPFPSVLLVEQASAPTTPSSGQARLYRGTDNKHYVVDDAGAVTELGAGGGAVPTVSASRVSTDLTISYSASLQAVDTALDLTIAAATGDVIELTMAGLMNNHSTGTNAMNVNFTAKTRVSAADVNNVAPSGATFVPAWFVADQGPATGGTSAFNLNGSHLYTVQSGDISGGNVTFRFYYQSANAGAATRTLYAAASTLPLVVHAKNLKH